MAKTVTLRIDEETYQAFQAHAKADNRPLSNLIETAAKRHLEECCFVNETEMHSILNDKGLVRRLRQGSAEAKAKRGRFVD